MRDVSLKAKLNGFRSETALARIVNELPQRPFLLVDQGVSMSLAGAQDKAAGRDR